MPAKKTKTVKKPNLRKWLVPAAIILGFLGLLFYFKNWFVVAWVDNRPISRLAYMGEVNRLAGQQALSTLITKRLILAEADKRNLTVSNEELNAEMQSLEGIAKQQGMSLDELLATQDLTRSVLIEEIRIQKLLEKMAGDITVSPEELQVYWEENQSLYPDQTLAELTNQLTNQIKQQKLSDAVQGLITQLQGQAKVITWL